MNNSIIADTFKPLTLDLLDEQHAEYWLKGGRGSTKSSFISIQIIIGMLRDPDANAIVYRKVGATIKDSVFAQMVWAIDMLRQNALFELRRSPYEIILRKTGQRIMFRGADDPMKSKSIKLNHGYFKYLWFEELTEFRGMDDIRTIKQSVFRGVKKAITFYSYNPPKTARNWVNEESTKSADGRIVHHSTYLDVPHEWLQDAFFTEAEAVRTTNDRAYRNEYLGEVTGIGGSVFENLQLREITDDEINSFDRFYNGLDFGFAADPDAFTRWHYDRKTRRLYAVAEYYGARTNIDTLAQKIAAIAGREIVRCDSADPRMITELKIRGISAIGAKKGAGSRDHGYRWLQDQGAIIVDPNRTPNIAREFSKYEFTCDKNGNFLPEYPDRDDHTCDSARYGLEPEITRRIATTRSDIY